MADSDLKAIYLRYLATCNARDWSTVGAMVSDDVEVNDERRGPSDYVAKIRELTDAFTDYRWEIRHLLVDGDLLAAHLVDRGTQQRPFLGVDPTGTAVIAPEFAVYRIDSGRIAAVWSTSDHLALLPRLNPTDQPFPEG